MSEEISNEQSSAPPDVQDIVRRTIEEFVRGEHRKSEPAYKVELHEERKRRESLEARVNQLVEENRKTRAAAEEVDRSSQIRSELQRLGVAKVDLAFKAVRDDIVRGEDGRLQAKGQDSKSLTEYLSTFVEQNPELLPARISGGSGAHASAKPSGPATSSISFDQIRPGMSKEEMDHVRQEISRLATQSLRGI